MLKILGFFNLLFGLLELHGFYNYIKLTKDAQNNLSSLLLTGDAYESFIYPLLLAFVGLFSLGIGICNLGAFPPKTNKQKSTNIILGALLIFLSSLVFWDVVIV